MRIVRPLLALTAALALIASGVSAAESPHHQARTRATAKTVKFAPAHDRGVVPGSFIVTTRPLTPDAVRNLAAELTAKHGGTLRFVYTAVIHGFSVSGLTDQTVLRIASDPRVTAVEPDRINKADGVQTQPDWGLDRIDQRNLPVNGTFTWGPDGSGVHIYGVDSGIRFTHNEFQDGSIRRASAGFDAIGDGENGNDCYGHGTHTAGVAAGNIFGVAKRASLVAVRVLNCSGTGNASGIIAGLDWIRTHAVKPAVTTMSLGTVVGTNQAEDDAVRNLVASGITVVTSAGNGIVSGVLSDNACNYSPGRVAEAITVSATRQDDQAPSWANYGTCVDIFAPGVNIQSAWATDGSGNPSDSASQPGTGTSESAPFVAGAAAMYLEFHPQASPAEIEKTLTDNATNGVITNAGTGSPNKLLYTAFMNGDTPTPTPTQTATPTPTPTATDPGQPDSPASPRLAQSSQNGFVTLTVQVDPRYNGDKIIFFVRSGQTGHVRPLGEAMVGLDGYAYRYLEFKQGQILAIYCKLLDNASAHKYSNDVTFKVQ